MPYMMNVIRQKILTVKLTGDVDFKLLSDANNKIQTTPEYAQLPYKLWDFTAINAMILDSVECASLAMENKEMFSKNTFIKTVFVTDKIEVMNLAKIYKYHSQIRPDENVQIVSSFQAALDWINTDKYISEMTNND